jgi:hypothetical protein
MRSRSLRVVAGALLSFCGAVLVTSAASASVATATKLTSGKAVQGKVTSASGVEYTFTGVTGQHVTLAITKPKIAPSGDSLQINAYDASGANLDSTTFSTSPTDINFAPTTYEAGTITVVVSPYNSGATGSFTLTYSTDVTGTLTSGTPVNGALKYEGQNADYTFTGVAGQHVTLAITKPEVTSGDSLQINAYDASGANLDSTTFSTSPTEIDFAPTTYEAGTITVVISQYNSGATGSFTLTYATDVTGTLKSGTPVNGALKYEGQNADYTFTGVAGRSVTLAITNPNVAPSGYSLQVNAYDPSDADLDSTTFSTSPTTIEFTPTSTQAGTITVVISQYNSGATGSFTLKYTAG